MCDEDRGGGAWELTAHTNTNYRSPLASYWEGVETFASSCHFWQSIRNLVRVGVWLKLSADSLGGVVCGHMTSCRRMFAACAVESCFIVGAVPTAQECTNLTYFPEYNKDDCMPWCCEKRHGQRRALRIGCCCKHGSWVCLLPCGLS